MNIVLGENFEYNEKIASSVERIIELEQKLRFLKPGEYDYSDDLNSLKLYTRSLLREISDQNKKAKEERVKMETEKLNFSIISDYRSAVLQLLDNLLEKEKIDLKEYKTNFSKIVKNDDLNVIASVSRELTAKYINV